MSLESLLGQFDTLADRSTNIAGIRKLLIINVIKRATSRKGFLDRAVEVKASLTPQTKTKAGKSTGTRNQDLALPEVLLKIPADAFARLGDVAEIEKGLTAIQKSIPGSYPLVVTAEARSTNATFDFEGPAVVIPMVSSTGHGHASLKRIHYQEGKFAAGNILSVVKPKRPDILNTRFLFEYLTAFKEELLVSRMVGTANVSLTINGLRDIPIPLIQGEDVAKVDELMALCDRLEAQLKERDIKQAALAKAALAKFTEDPSPENLQLLFHPSFAIEPNDLRKTILSLSIRGKLIPQKLGETTSIRSSIIDFSPLFEIPKNWSWVVLGDLHPDFQNGESSRGDKNGVPVIVVRLSDIHNRRINLEQPRRVAIDPGQIKKYALRRGDTLVTRVNGSAEIVGRFIPVSDSLDAIHCDHFIRMRIDAEKIHPPFTALLGESLHVRDQIQKLFVSTTGQKTVNQGHICSLTLPLPPLNEQVRVVAKVEELMKLIDQLEAQIEGSRTTGEKLLEAMVAELTSA